MNSFFTGSTFTFVDISPFVSYFSWFFLVTFTQEYTGCTLTFIKPLKSKHFIPWVVCIWSQSYPLVCGKQWSIYNTVSGLIDEPMNQTETLPRALTVTRSFYFCSFSCLIALAWGGGRGMFGVGCLWWRISLKNDEHMPLFVPSAVC